MGNQREDSPHYRSGLPEQPSRAIASMLLAGEMSNCSPFARLCVGDIPSMWYLGFCISSSPLISGKVSLPRLLLWITLEWSTMDGLLHRLSSCRLISRESCVAVWRGAVFCPGGARRKFYAHRWAAAPFLVLFCRCGSHRAGSAALARLLWPLCFPAYWRISFF